MARLLALLLFALCCSSLGFGESAKPTMYEQAYAQFQEMSAMPAQGALVANITIKRDVATFAFEEGKIFLCTPVLGRTVAAVFYGKGTFSFEPPLQVERDQLNRFYEKQALKEQFTFMMMIFADSTLRELYHKCKFEALTESPSRANISRGLEYMGKKEGKEFDPEIMKTLLELQSNDLFYAYMDSKDQGDLFFEIDPSSDEEVTFMRRADIPLVLGRFREVISQFHLQRCYATGATYHRPEREFIRTQKYTIESRFSDGLDFSARADIHFFSTKENQQWVYFTLSPFLDVDSVILRGKGPITFFRGKENQYLWVNFDPPLSTGQSCTLQVSYHGDLIEKNEDLAWVTSKSPDFWYPRYDWKNKQLYDLTYHVPSRLTFSSVGKKTTSTSQNDVETSQWITPRPIRNASFNLGYFKEYNTQEDTVPAVTVQISDYAHRLLARGGVASGSDMEEDVGVDVMESLRFFQHLFGRCSAERLYATEIPGNHGEAFEGLIHLSWSTFQNRAESGSDEIFRAHEVAHQWWGIGVDFMTYHDQWLSEAFSTYSGLWYMQAMLRDNDKFFDQLRQWKENIFSARKFLFGSGQESGPIWLGYRTHSSSTRGDYDLIIYKKGAWVLHMLRNMLVDLKTMNEDKFQNILRTFYSTYAGSSASTADFQRIVEQEMGIDMSWFFKQWIFDTRIPKYTFSYKTEQTADEKYKVTCKIEQSSVADDFQMAIPLYVDFGDNKFVRLRIVARGPVSQVELPLLPMKPEKIIFNDMESVLCEVDYTDWK